MRCSKVFGAPTERVSTTGLDHMEFPTGVTTGAATGAWIDIVSGKEDRDESNNAASRDRWIARGGVPI